MLLQAHARGHWLVRWLSLEVPWRAAEATALLHCELPLPMVHQPGLPNLSGEQLLANKPHQVNVVLVAHTRMKLRQWL